MYARALPGGAVERAFYDAIKAELLDGLRAALPLDGLFFDIHGAMTVGDMTDAEGDLASAIRTVVGPACLISASMDPYGTMSRRLVTALDPATSHRMSPHEDAALTKKRAVANLVHCLDRGVRPLRRWVRVPVLLPGERGCTRDEPAKGIYGRLPAIERREGVIDAAVWIGYAWADEPRRSAAVVVTGTDRDAIVGEAHGFAEAYWGPPRLVRRQRAVRRRGLDHRARARVSGPTVLHQRLGRQPDRRRRRGRRVHARTAARRSRPPVRTGDGDLGELRRTSRGRAMRAHRGRQWSSCRSAARSARPD